jgi:phage tail protein X
MTARITEHWSRRAFLVGGVIAGAGALVSGHGVAAAQSAAPEAPKPSAPKPPPLEPLLVKEFVGAAHGDLEKTRRMLEAEPGLLNATWDWKAGDFETALGGAGHMGRRDIAEYLIAQGARIDLFVAAMLGELGIVRAILDARPGLARSKGPHGITLVAHAKAGGERAIEVLRYLEALEAR